MPINSKHPQYLEYEDRLLRTQAAREGADAVKAFDIGRSRNKRGTAVSSGEIDEAFIPRLSGDTDDEYAAYVGRAVWFAATGQTVDAMKGMAMRRKPKAELPASLEYLEESADDRGRSLHAVTTDCLDMTITGKRTALLVDRPDGEEGGDLFFVLRRSLDVVNWRYDGDGELEMVVFKETYEEKDPEDEYKAVSKVQYRELRLVETDDPENPRVYVQRVHRKDAEDNWYSEERFPTARGVPLDSIPLVFVGGDIGDPMILSLANMNRAHYRNSADLENGLHVCGLPKPYATGATQEQIGTRMEMGMKSMKALPDSQARMRFLEFTGAGLGEITSGMRDKERQMARTGARMIEPPREGVEAAETARIYANTASATLSTVVGVVEDGFLAALKIAAEWEGENPDSVSFQMSRDFATAEMEPAAVDAAVRANAAGSLSRRSMVAKLKAGEWLPEDTSVDDELRQLEDEDAAAG